MITFQIFCKQKLWFNHQRMWCDVIFTIMTTANVDLSTSLTALWYPLLAVMVMSNTQRQQNCKPQTAKICAEMLVWYIGLEALPASHGGRRWFTMDVPTSLLVYLGRRPQVHQPCSSEKMIWALFCVERTCGWSGVQLSMASGQPHGAVLPRG